MFKTALRFCSFILKLLCHCISFHRFKIYTRFCMWISRTRRKCKHFYWTGKKLVSSRNEPAVKISNGRGGFPFEFFYHAAKKKAIMADRVVQCTKFAQIRIKIFDMSEWRFHKQKTNKRTKSKVSASNTRTSYNFLYINFRTWHVIALQKERDGWKLP